MTKLRIKTCLIAERDHKRELRAYAHWGHKDNTICVAEAIYKLPLSHSLALIAHEVGHAIIDGGTEEEANKYAQKYIGVFIAYIPSTPWGQRLQYISVKHLEEIYNSLKTYVESSSLKFFDPLQ